MAYKVEHPADPAATASTSLVMMGLGVTIRPDRSGLMQVSLSGVAFTATAAVNFTAGGRYGTGAPPANGAAVSGTRFGGATDQVLRAGVLGVGTGLNLEDVVSLIPGTTYWFDLALLTSVGADVATAQSLSIVLVELP